MLNGLSDGDVLLADRAYDSDTHALAGRGAWANVKPMPNRVNIPAFSRYHDRYRNLVGALLQQAPTFPGYATRYEKHDANYLALVKFASLRIWMRFMSRRPSPFDSSRLSLSMANGQSG